MSTLGDALAAIRNVVLMQERLDVMNRKIDRLADDVKDLGQYAFAIDKRLVRIETMIEVAGRRGYAPGIEG